MRRRFFASGQSVALFGGSFDPPHDGHRLVAAAALKQLGVDFVWWLVSPQNPLKPQASAAMADRLAATRKLARHPRFLVTDEEARLGTRHAIDTVRALQAHYRHVRFIWLIGADNLAEMHHWKRWQDLMQTVPVAVYPRPGATVKAAFAPAARRFCARRLADGDAALLRQSAAPAWLLLRGPGCVLASRNLRPE